MSRSTIYLLDVNVLLALATSRHHHHAPVSRFVDTISQRQLGLCRVTQMGFLRLLTNKAVMAEDVLSGKQAWGLFEALLKDERFHFMDEPKGLDKEWRRLSTLPGWGPSRWTDDYLLAFAKVLELRLLTFDAGVLSRSGGLAQII
jgi:toxin-antitoxin system PIN domain toxin